MPLGNPCINYDIGCLYFKIQNSAVVNLCVLHLIMVVNVFEAFQNVIFEVLKYSHSPLPLRLRAVHLDCIYLSNQPFDSSLESIWHGFFLSSPQFANESLKNLELIFVFIGKSLCSVW